tara:strand:- start:121 stop:699 length:579 start_codon:yes stop_codon:yes gene_type:complete
MSDTEWLGYNVKFELPVKYINLSEEFGGINSKIEYYIRKTGDMMNHVSNVKASMTDWDSHEKNSHINAIAKKALFLCQDGMKAKYPLEIADCWGALYTKGEHTVEHHHWPFTWSFTYYVKVSDNTAPLVFHNILNPEKEFVNMPIQPKKGDMFIFPSTLRHSVPEQESDEERIMVAGNIWYNFNSTYNPNTK